MHDIDEIKRRVAAWHVKQREQAREFAAAQREGRPMRRRRRPSGLTREALSRRVFEHYRAEALPDPATTPLKRARLLAGLTLVQAGELAGVGRMVPWRAEQPGAQQGDLAQRLLAVYEKPADGRRLPERRRA